MTASTPSAAIGDGGSKVLSAWYPNLPSAWNLGRVKSIARRVTDGAHISPDTDGGVYDFVSTRDLSGGQIDFFGSLKTTPETYQYMVRTGCQPWDGDVLFSKDGTVGSTALVIGNHQFVVASSLVIITPDQRRVDSRFLQFVFASKTVKEQSAVMMRGAGLPRLSVGNLARIEIPIPPLDEQRRIADYLDRETAQIDSLILKQEQLISGLRERRFGVIASQTLRGVDPLHVSTNATVAFAALGYGYSVTLGKMLDTARNVKSTEQVLPYIRAANIQDDGLHLHDVNSMPFSAAEARSLDLRAGDVLVVEGGAVGTSIVITDPMPGWSFQKTVNRLRPIADWDPRFASYVLRTYRDIGVIDVVCNKSTIAHLTAEKLRALRVPAPSVDEQRRIADYLDDQTAKIDALIAKAEKFIALARERRAALITEAVTGRIDVSTGRAPEGA